MISQTFNGCLYFNETFLNFSFETLLYLKGGLIYHRGWRDGGMGWRVPGGRGDCPTKTGGGVHGGIFLGGLSRHGFEDNLINQTETSTLHTYLMNFKYVL